MEKRIIIFPLVQKLLGAILAVLLLRVLLADIQLISKEFNIFEFVAIVILWGSGAFLGLFSTHFMKIESNKFFIARFHKWEPLNAEDTVKFTYLRQGAFIIRKRNDNLLKIKIVPFISSIGTEIEKTFWVNRDKSPLIHQ